MDLIAKARQATFVLFQDKMYRMNFVDTDYFSVTDEDNGNDVLFYFNEYDNTHFKFFKLVEIA